MDEITRLPTQIKLLAEAIDNGQAEHKYASRDVGGEISAQKVTITKTDALDFLVKHTNFSVTSVLSFADKEENR
jgi:hypothetical protein